MFRYIALFVLITHPVVATSLDNLLTSYELLDPMRIISKRSLHDDSDQHLHFQAFGRSFHLVLRQEYSGTVPSGLTVQTMHNNVVKPHNVSALFSDFFSGYIYGERATSHVSGYHADGRRIHLTIDDGIDILTIEPLSVLSWNHTDNRLLAYYDRDIKASEHFCAAMDVNKVAPAHDQPHYGGRPHLQPPSSGSKRPHLHQRQRRSAEPLQRVCRLQLVADHTFVRNIAGSFGSAVKCLIQIADDINMVYRGTQFIHPETGELFTGIGFELANLVVLENPELLLPISHFNAPPVTGYQFTASKYLEAFGDYDENRLDLASYCLNHLVTFRPMMQNILGLAYLGSPYVSYIGGICSPPSMSTYGRRRLIGRNIGMTTYANKDGNPILSRQALLVSAHELGHNMGSEHDPVQPGVCSPTWMDGGPYLMYQIAVSGNADHHSRFSECSRKQIAVVIRARQQDCFHVPRNTVCGNGRREANEACDAGSRQDDRCCNDKCELRPGARCSDANFACCHNCQPALSGTLCQRQSPLYPCKGNSTCDGVRDTCPEPRNLPDRTPCQFDVGSCVAGNCESVCKELGRQPCSCQGTAESCLVCCQPPGPSADSNRSSCVPYHRPSDRKTINLPANQPCTIGRCLANGTCQSLPLGNGQLIVRLWDLIVQSGSNSFATFLWKNIVFTVIFISLLLWIPACLLIAHQERVDARIHDKQVDPAST